MSDEHWRPEPVLKQDGKFIYVGDRKWPARITVEDLVIPNGRLDDSDFSYRSRNAQVIFENGWCLSMSWGQGTYSPNHWYPHGLVDGPTAWVEEPWCVEIASWNVHDEDPDAHWTERTKHWVTWPSGDNVYPEFPVKYLPPLLDYLDRLAKDAGGFIMSTLPGLPSGLGELPSP